MLKLTQRLFLATQLNSFLESYKILFFNLSSKTIKKLNSELTKAKSLLIPSGKNPMGKLSNYIPKC